MLLDSEDEVDAHKQAQNDMQANQNACDLIKVHANAVPIMQANQNACELIKVYAVPMLLDVGQTANLADRNAP